MMDARHAGSEGPDSSRRSSSARGGRWASIARLAWRESRTARRRLLLYMSSISLGVGALVAIDSFAENVTRSVHDQSRSLLGGDIAISSNAPLKPEAAKLLDSLRARGVGVTRSTNFASMAFVPRSGGTRLVNVRAVGAGFPFYGNIITKPASAWSEIQHGRNAIVDPALLVSLDARLGDTLALGFGRFVISGELESVPGEIGISAAIGPRVYIPDADLSGTGLLVFGSRADYQTLVKLPPSLSPGQFIGRYEKRFRDAGARVRTAGYNESRLAESIDQLHDFLSIVGLVALLLGGIGVASGVHAFAMRKIEPVAILRCLGATSWQVLAIYTAQAALMGLVGAMIGAVLGVAIQFAFPYALRDFLPVDVDVTLTPAALGLGAVIGVWVAIIFALRPLVALRRVSPLQALRRESDADVLRRTRTDPLGFVVTFAIVASVLALGMSRADTVQRGIAFSIAIGLAIAALWSAAALLAWGAKRIVRPSMPFVVRQGVASLYRPGNQTRAVVLALGFGVFLMGTLYQVQHNLLRTISGKLLQARANVVFFDVQEPMRPGIDSILRTDRYEVLEETPLVPMRISSINGRSVADIAGDSAGGRRRPSWALRREFRSTFRDSIGPAERVVAGRWFGAAPSGDSTFEVSLDEGVAQELRVKLGDAITWDVQGVKVPTRVTSLRKVNWASFEPNFFAVFEPRALAAAPKQFVILARVPDARAMARLQRQVVSSYPSVSSLDLTLVQQTISSVLGKVTVAIRFLALISLGLGIPVLFSAVAATRRERLREGVLLKTLGATKRQIGRIMFAEYALLGALGALSGIVLSTLAAWALSHWIFRVGFAPAPVAATLVALAMMAIAVTIGLLTGRDVFAETPMAALRES